MSAQRLRTIIKARRQNTKLDAKKQDESARVLAKYYLLIAIRIGICRSLFMLVPAFGVLPAVRFLQQDSTITGSKDGIR